MARLWSSGFELNTTTAGKEFTTVTGAGATVQTSTVRSGTYAGRITSLSSGTPLGFLYQYASAAGDGPWFVRFYFRYATLPSASNTIFCFDNDTTVGEGAASSIKLSSAGKLQLFATGSQVGSDSAALSANTWYMVEVQINGTGSPGSEVLRAKLDGTEFAGSSALTLTSTVHSVTFGGNLASEFQTTGDWFFDDIAINDSTGSFQTSYPDAGSIIHLRPNAAGDNTDWNRGGVDSGANWSQVDEVAPNDSTDDVTTGTSGRIDDYNIDDTPSALNTGSTINVVAVGERSAKDDLGTAPLIVVRIKASSGGTVEESGTISSATGTYHTNSPSAPKNYPLTLYDLPGASTTAWTKADLDTAQIGIRLTNTPASVSRVTALWLLVEYVPGADTPTVTDTASAMLSDGVSYSGGATQF